VTKPFIYHPPIFESQPEDLRKIRRKTNESERPRVPGARPAIIPERSQGLDTGRATLVLAAREVQFFDEFFVSLDFFFVTFLCIKTKESKVVMKFS
jgi:hypothetical protein